MLRYRIEYWQKEAEIEPSSPIIFENIFVNMGEMGKLYLTIELKNDRLGNN